MPQTHQLAQKEDDTVKLVNPTAEACTFMFNSVSYTIPAKSASLVKRYLANHAILKSRRVEAGSVKYPLNVEEIENPRMNDNELNETRLSEIKDLTDDNRKFKSIVEALEAELKDVKKENSELMLEVERFKDQVRKAKK